MLEQLRATWHDLDPLYDWDEAPLVLTTSAVEAMAQLEHLRWMAETQRHGYRRGAVRNDAERVHDLLVPWAELPEEARNIDRGMVARRPSIVTSAGLRIVRDPTREQLARRHHERYLEQFDSSERPYAVPWDELEEAQRELNRAAIDHIALKLAAVGRRALPAALLPAESSPLSPVEIEAMAGLEHERWVDERVRLGWRRGARDDEARQHPWLVPWDELPEPEREVDRMFVRQIPALLGAVHYAISEPARL
jgi:hypothetical protein